jgi:hypothetical protein
LAQMWPREVFDLKDGKKLVFRHREYLSKPGVYVLYRDEVPHYIGRTERPLFERLREHANSPTDRYYNFWNLFSAFVVPNARRRKDLERILIAAMPTANSSMPRMKKIEFPEELAEMLRRVRQNRAHIVTEQYLQKALKATAGR